MNTVLIITSAKSSHGIDTHDRFAYVQDFCDAVELKLADTRVCFTTYEDITVTVLDGKVRMYDTRNSLDLFSVTFVHFKNWINDTQIAGAIAKALRHAGVGVYNSEVYGNPARTKLAQMVLLAQAQIVVPDTFFASNAVLRNLFVKSELPKGFSLPFIMKANDGAKGNDNYLVRSFDQAIKVLDEAGDELEFVVQTYHENEGDYRFLFIGLESEPMVFLRKGGADTHLNNTSQGGSGTRMDSQRVPREYYEIAQKAAAVTGREIGGVDLLVDKHTNVPYVLEVNQTPALATGYDVETKIEKFAAFINEHLDEEEEE